MPDAEFDETLLRAIDAGQLDPSQEAGKTQPSFAPFCWNHASRIAYNKPLVSAAIAVIQR